MYFHYKLTTTAQLQNSNQEPCKCVFYLMAHKLWQHSGLLTSRITELESRASRLSCNTLNVLRTQVKHAGKMYMFSCRLLILIVHWIIGIFIFFLIKTFVTYLFLCIIWILIMYILLTVYNNQYAIFLFWHEYNYNFLHPQDVALQISMSVLHHSNVFQFQISVKCDTITKMRN